MTSLLTFLKEIEIQSSYRPATDCVPLKWIYGQLYSIRKTKYDGVRKSRFIVAATSTMSDVGYSLSEVAVKEIENNPKLDVYPKSAYRL